MAVRLIGITQGKTSDPHAASGINQTVFSALARRVQVVDVLDNSMQGWKRYWNAAIHWRPNRDLWRESFDLNTWSYQQLSKSAEAMLSAHTDFDLVFQMRTMYAPGFPPVRWPYVILTDNTYALSDRYYPSWAPMGRKEKESWFEMERLTYQNAVAVFARSHWLRKSLIEDYGLLPEKAVWVGTGSNFAPDSLPQHKAEDDGRTVLFVGKELKRKGVPTLLEAFKLVRKAVPDARLRIVGRDLQVDQPGVEVLGKILDRARIRELYQQASLFVLPAYFEPCGNVITEAMGYSLPCVVTNAGGLADQVLDGETGYVIPPADPGMLAERMIDLLRSPDKRRQMGEKGAQRVREVLNWDCVVERMLPYFEKQSVAD